MKLSHRLFVAFAMVLYSYAQPTALSQGVMLRSVGAVNASVGGTATAMPLDAMGALQWNPASISALPKNEMAFGLELVMADSRVKSSVSTPMTMSGSTKGEQGVVPAPSMGIVWSKNRQSPYTFGLGLGAVGGAASLYPHTPFSGANPNPVLMSHGRSATVVVLQVTPTVAVQLTERWSVGVAPLIDLASLTVNPMSLGRKTDESLMTYGTKYVWGGGFQIGTLYDFKNHVKAGFMFKSPIWAEKLYFTGTRYGTSGTPIADSNKFQLQLPMTLSAGLSYDGFRNTVIGMDVRYLDYDNAAGLNSGMVDGVVEGLGWESVYSICVGAERTINSKLRGRLGYCWNENPIPGRSAALCISAPMITQHVLSCGFSYAIVKDLELSAAYSHAFEAKNTGPIPGGSVTNILSANSVFAGVTKKW
ncbi:MAG: outer membrane protein transport protein [Planctomycetaceae bacterium]|jgi:long-chain fatty acid transport protein|nr:outer membrane protein transport protein [Planctomycetaceae bacterium]